MPANKKAASTADGDSRQKTPGSSRASVGARMASRNSGFKTADAHGSFMPPDESSSPSAATYVETPKSSQRGAQPRPTKSSTSPRGASRNNQKSSSPENGSLSFGPVVPSDAMDDVCFRFLYNIPEYEQNDQIRVCFQLEQAHWYYVDFYCDNPSYPECKNLRFHEFARQVFYNCDFLLKWRHCVDDILDQFRYYKSNVPTYGAILLDESLNHILLVQGYFSSKNSWGFPKGKVNQNEDPVHCAIREVLEETGYDITDKIVPNRVFQYFINDTLVRLYVVKGVEMNFHFEPHLRKEIRKISWFSVWDLPKDRSDEESCARLGLGPNNLYTVLPFVNDIQAFVRREQEQRQGRGNAVTQKSYLDSMFSSDRGPWAGQSPSAQTVHQSGFSGVNPGTGNESVFKPLMLDAGSQPTSFTGQGFLEMIRASTSSQTALLHKPGVIGGEVHNKRKDIQVPKPIHRSRPILTVYEAPKEPLTKPDSGQLTAQAGSFLSALNTSPRLLANQIFEAPTDSSSKTEIANMLISTVTSNEARHPEEAKVHEKVDVYGHGGRRECGRGRRYFKCDQ
ncbi:mRNA-decapping enzyme 2 [Aphelenchoides avenae]|nr:mRNA-decapping enzyme 2 [Aphelenchus avenae]